MYCFNHFMLRAASLLWRHYWTQAPKTLHRKLYCGSPNISLIPWQIFEAHLEYTKNTGCSDSHFLNRFCLLKWMREVWVTGLVKTTVTPAGQVKFLACTQPWHNGKKEIAQWIGRAFLFIWPETALPLQGSVKENILCQEHNLCV